MDWHPQSRAAFTLVEVMIAMALLAILGAGLFATGSMVLRTTSFNRVSLEARALGIQRLEELTAQSIPNIAMQVPFPVLTNHLLFGEPVVRTINVVGHHANRTVNTNIAGSDYLECHVLVSYQSPLSGADVTNIFSSIVK
jgi:prepilin-type N-terminal cleavage/methylation domain-containing protein